MPMATPRYTRSMWCVNRIPSGHIAYNDKALGVCSSVVNRWRVHKTGCRTSEDTCRIFSFPQYASLANFIVVIPSFLLWPVAVVEFDEAATTFGLNKSVQLMTATLNIKRATARRRYYNWFYLPVVWLPQKASSLAQCAQQALIRTRVDHNY